MCEMLCLLTLAHDPSFQRPRDCGWGTQCLSTHSQSARGLEEFCGDGSERDAFCTIQLDSPLLHHRGYVDCFFGATCTVSGGVAFAVHPVSLNHSQNSTRLCDLVRQATSQVQLCSRDFGDSPRHTCLTWGDCCPPEKDAIEPVSPNKMR